ncbi:phosphotransferase [Actinoplanes sp. NPDC049548]|uniref:phosphotransferase family protein n=1 Tax=Actinoplanes sp. NPDC049548 TaxID=3155152 RepID=UPI00343CA968
MRPVSLPEVAYGATAVRPDWDDLPLALRAAIEDRLGARVTASTTAGGGFTRAFAGVVEMPAGRRAFLKAAPLNDPNADAYAREAAVTAVLPPEVPAPRLRWTLIAADHFVLCLDAVDGRVPSLPWRPAELTAVLQSWRVAADALAASPMSGLPRMSDIVRAELSWWSEIAAGRAPLPPGPRWVGARLDDLAELERGLPPLVAGTGMLHGDLRMDNTMIDGYGHGWLCDWTWPCLGAPWFDTVTLLVTAYASGLDVDLLLEPWGAPDAGVDGVLAAMGGYWLTRAAGGPSSASPHSRQHQRFSGEQALAWLASRRGWKV